MDNRTKNYIIELISCYLIFLVGCATQTGAIYKPNEAGKIMEVKKGILLNSREILISGLDEEKKNWGSIVGAVVAGTAAYGLTEGDTPLEQAAIVIATIGGAMAGTFIDEQIQTTPGHEYTIQLEDGKNIVIVQASEDKKSIIDDGTEVSIVYSNTGYVRVVP